MRKANVRTFRLFLSSENICGLKCFTICLLIQMQKQKVLKFPYTHKKETSCLQNISRKQHYFLSEDHTLLRHNFIILHNGLLLAREFENSLYGSPAAV